MDKKSVSAIVAVARNGAIGRRGQLLCHLSADLKHFKAITMGHTIVMGRRTFESFPKGPLPGRQNVVVTRNRAYVAPEGVTVVHSLEEALQAANMPGEVIVIGGAEIYAQALPLVHTLHLTRIEADFPDADAFFPDINTDEWKQTSQETHDADERNQYPFTFITMQRKEQ